MNKQRRKEIGEILTEVSNLEDTIQSLINQTQSLLDEEQDYLDNMPESFADGEKGEKAQVAIDALQEAIVHLGDAQASLNEAQEV